MLDPICRRTPRARLLQRPHVIVHCNVLLRATLTASPQATYAATDLADHDGNANGHGKEQQGETFANVP
jgi:hypothetical protein